MQSIMYDEISDSDSATITNAYYLHHKQIVADIDVTLALPVAQRFSCKLASGEIGVLLAASGAGKSSVFNAISGLADAQGSLLVGVNLQQQAVLPSYKRQVSYVMQTPVIFNHLTIDSLIKLVAEQQTTPFDINWALAPLALVDKLHFRPSELSGGQKQRLALVLAMLKGAPLLLLDEVLCGQDQRAKIACIQVIKTYLQKNNAAALVACHQMEDALLLADVGLIQTVGEHNTEWQSYPINAAINLYQHSLLEHTTIQGDEAQSASTFLSFVRARCSAHFNTLGLSEFKVSGQTCFSALNPNIPAGKTVGLLLKANRIGLAKKPMIQSSFVNQWLVQILSARAVTWQGEHGMLIDVQLVNTEKDNAVSNDMISVWITRLSFNQLQPKPHEQWYLICKADAVSVKLLA